MLRAKLGIFWWEQGKICTCFVFCKAGQQLFVCDGWLLPPLGTAPAPAQQWRTARNARWGLKTSEGKHNSFSFLRSRASYIQSWGSWNNKRRKLFNRQKATFRKLRSFFFFFFFSSSQCFFKDFECLSDSWITLQDSWEIYRAQPAILASIHSLPDFFSSYSCALPLISVAVWERRVLLCFGFLLHLSPTVLLLFVSQLIAESFLHSVKIFYSEFNWAVLSQMLA